MRRRTIRVRFALDVLDARRVFVCDNQLYVACQSPDRTQSYMCSYTLVPSGERINIARLHAYAPCYERTTTTTRRHTATHERPAAPHRHCSPRKRERARGQTDRQTRRARASSIFAVRWDWFNASGRTRFRVFIISRRPRLVRSEGANQNGFQHSRDRAHARETTFRSEAFVSACCDSVPAHSQSNKHTDTHANTFTDNSTIVNGRTDERTKHHARRTTLERVNIMQSNRKHGPACMIASSSSSLC